MNGRAFASGVGYEHEYQMLQSRAKLLQQARKLSEKTERRLRKSTVAISRASAAFYALAEQSHCANDVFDSARDIALSFSMDRINDILTKLHQVVLFGISKCEKCVQKGLKDLLKCSKKRHDVLKCVEKMSSKVITSTKKVEHLRSKQRKVRRYHSQFARLSEEHVRVFVPNIRLMWFSFVHSQLLCLEMLMSPLQRYAPPMSKVPYGGRVIVDMLTAKANRTTTSTKFSVSDLSNGVSREPTLTEVSTAPLHSFLSGQHDYVRCAEDKNCTMRTQCHRVDSSTYVANGADVEHVPLSDRLPDGACAAIPPVHDMHNSSDEGACQQPWQPLVSVELNTGAQAIPPPVVASRLRSPPSQTLSAHEVGSAGSEAEHRPRTASDEWERRDNKRRDAACHVPPYASSIPPRRSSVFRRSLSMLCSPKPSFFSFHKSRVLRSFVKSSGGSKSDVHVKRQG